MALCPPWNNAKGLSEHKVVPDNEPVMYAERIKNAWPCKRFIVVSCLIIFHTLLKDAINAVGKKHNYAYVLNTDVNAYPYISSDGENCTDAVLIQLGIK